MSHKDRSELDVYIGKYSVITNLLNMIKEKYPNIFIDWLNYSKNINISCCELCEDKTISFNEEFKCSNCYKEKEELK